MESNFRGVKISIFHPERTEMRYVPIRDEKEKVYRPIKMQNGIFIRLRSFMSYDGKEFPTLDKARIYNERYYNAMTNNNCEYHENEHNGIHR